MREELFKLALLSVGKRKKRAALTMLGVFIGIAAVVALVSLGQGLQQTINEQFERVGADKIVVQAKDIGFVGQHAPGVMAEDELGIVQRVHGVSEAAGVLFRSVQVRFKGVQRTVFVNSVPDDAREADLVAAFSLWEVVEGRLLSHRDKGKAVVGHTIAKKNKFDREVRVGDKLEIDGRKIEVVGVLKRTGDPGLDGSVILAEEDVRAALNESVAFTYIVARAGDDPEVVEGRIRKAIRRDRHLDEGKEDFLVQTSTDLIESFNQVLTIVQVVFVGIAAISLLVGGIGIMNTMYTAVLERTREIGVMKAIGAKNEDVLGLFLIESGVLGLAGGVVGVLVGVGISKGVELAANSLFGAGTITAAYPWWLLVGVLVFACVVGMLSGYLPARRASLLKPVDALRYE